jgi:hypothetical protein
MGAAAAARTNELIVVLSNFESAFVFLLKVVCKFIIAILFKLFAHHL